MPVRAADELRLPNSAQHEIDALIVAAMHDGLIPGAQLVVVARKGHAGEGTIPMRRGCCVQTLEPAAVPNDMQTVYEFASVTKAACTADAIMLLVQRRVLRLGDRVST